MVSDSGAINACLVEVPEGERSHGTEIPLLCVSVCVSKIWYLRETESEQDKSLKYGSVPINMG